MNANEIKPLPLTNDHLVSGDEQRGAVEYNEDGGYEVIATTLDPREEIFNRIDGPLLPLDKSSQWEYFADYLARLFDWIRCDERVLKIPKEDVGLRALTVCKLLFNDLDATILKERYGVSKQSLSQCMALFRAEFGDVATLRTRSPESRDRMKEAQLNGSNHWRQKKMAERKAVPNGHETMNDATATTQSQSL